MNSTEILDAVNARLLEKWPERTVYINVCPEDYDRPSFWLEVTRDDRTPVMRRVTKRNVQIRLTLHDEADEHYDISWARLNNDDAGPACGNAQAAAATAEHAAGR